MRTRDEAGLALALVSAATFGTSGTFAAALLGAGCFPRPSGHGPAIPWPPW